MEANRIGTAHPRTCSHQWRDKAVWQQLVGNTPVAPWDMVPGKTYICLACKTELTPPRTSNYDARKEPCHEHS
jgi:hypothetical protein